MDEQQAPLPPTELTTEGMTFWQRHRLTLMLGLTLVTAIILTCVSVAIYYASDAALLDFSRPGYREMSSKVDHSEKVDTYSGVGPVNKQTINEFLSLYDKQSEKAKKVDAFNGDPLNPEVLEFGTSASAEE